jgi:hypothetical protein
MIYVEEGHTRSGIHSRGGWIFLPSRTSAETNVMSAEATYWITEYVLVTLKLKIMPSSNVI